MTRTLHRLSAAKVRTITQPGLHADGGNLYLQVTASDDGKTIGRSWIFRYTAPAGGAAKMGLGSAKDVSLARAREIAAEYRQQLADGKDPKRERKRVKDAAKSITLEEAAKSLIGSKEAGWRNDKHRQQWCNTLATYVYPTIGETPVADITVDDVVKVLDPIWTIKPETAGRVRGRIESVLSWAKARGYRTGENPAAWKDNLAHILPPRSKVRRVKHHAALPYAEIPQFMRELSRREGVSNLALKFVILTAARTGEALGAEWPEIDFEARLWTVPAERMKAGKEHRVPLSPQAIVVLRRMLPLREGPFIFVGQRKGRPLSNMALLMQLRDLRPGVTTHGFRSSFKDWSSEATSTPNFVSEAALAHVVADKVEAAYRRSDLLERRRQLMNEWAAFCMPAHKT
ncbi:MAG: tyrosine-type recombinase/integrase [Hyphomicrobiaceae bacterium]